MTPEALAVLDTTISDLRTQTSTAIATAKTLRSTLSSLNSTLSTTDLVSSVKSLQSEKTELTERLGALKEGKAKKVTKKERDDVENEWRKWNTATKRREKIVDEMWKIIEDCLPDPSPEKKTELREALGLDE
jgi:26S proteasome regulatory subunit (ATPase 3-interacting protein)